MPVRAKVCLCALGLVNFQFCFLPAETFCENMEAFMVLATLHCLTMDNFAAQFSRAILWAVMGVCVAVVVVARICRDSKTTSAKNPIRTRRSVPSCDRRLSMALLLRAAGIRKARRKKIRSQKVFANEVKNIAIGRLRLFGGAQFCCKHGCGESFSAQNLAASHEERCCRTCRTCKKVFGHEGSCPKTKF
jgi:hypothetical protein